MKGKKANILFKIVLEKAFNKLKWSFIYNTLSYFQIPPKITSLIMSYITSSKTTILINGTRTKFFTPSRGICRGDPLSPYIFILCMEVLSRNITKKINQKFWHSIKTLPKEGATSLTPIFCR